MMVPIAVLKTRTTYGEEAMNSFLAGSVPLTCLGESELLELSS